MAADFYEISSPFSGSTGECGTRIPETVGDASSREGEIGLRRGMRARISGSLEIILEKHDSQINPAPLAWFGRYLNGRLVTHHGRATTTIYNATS